jgi:hypothetical protein
MRNVGFGQLVVLLLLCFLLFGDFTRIKEKVLEVSHTFKIAYLKMTGKKGVEPLTFGFGNHCSTSELYSPFIYSIFINILKIIFIEIKNPQ